MATKGDGQSVPAELRRERLVEAIVAGRSVTDAAAEIGISRQRASGMLAEDGTRTMLAERRAQVATEHRAMLSEIHGRALAVVRDALAAPDAELEQALAVLKTMGPTLGSAHEAALAEPEKVKSAIQNERLFGDIFG